MIGPPNREAVFLLVRLHLVAGRVLRRRHCAKAVAGERVEHLAVELVRAGLRHRGDGSARELVVLGLVVLRDDLVLADAELRKRIAARGILAGDAALQHVVLLADAVDVDIDVARRLRAALELRRAVVGIDAERDARDHVGELEEVARRLRDRVDDLRRHRAADLGRLDLRQRERGDGDAFERRRRFAGCGEIELRGLRDAQRDRARGAARGFDRVGAGRQVRQRVAAVARSGHVPNEARRGVRRRDLGAAGGFAAQCRAGALCEGRRRAEGETAGERAGQQRWFCNNEARTSRMHGVVTPQMNVAEKIVLTRSMQARFNWYRRATPKPKRRARRRTGARRDRSRAAR